MVESFLTHITKTFPHHKESDVHFHDDAEERSQLFTSMDGTTTELETLNLINALVYYYKPFRVIETGTWIGMGTIAIADALKRNGFGMLHTIEKERDLFGKAEENVKKYDPELLKYITFYLDDSMKWIPAHKELMFNFGFYDSGPIIRAKELKLMVDLRMTKKNFVGIIHDTSKFQAQSFYKAESDVMIKELDELEKGHDHFEGELSRGWRMIKF